MKAWLLAALLVVPQVAASPTDFLAANWLTTKWEEAKAKGSQLWDNTKSGAQQLWTTIKVVGSTLGPQVQSAATNSANTVKETVTPSSPPAAKPADILCAEQGMSWDGRSCLSAQDVDDLAQMKCLERGQYWDGTQCREPSNTPPRPAAPPTQSVQPCQPGQYYDARNDECWKSKLDYDIQTCADSGKFWYANACRTEDQAMQAACQEDGGQLNANDRLCYQRDDVEAVCADQGALWVASHQKCYVGGAGDIPRGLEKFYFQVRTPQEKALYGAYRDALTKSLYDRETAIRQAVEANNQAHQDALDAQETELRAFYERQLQDLDTESARRIAELGQDFQAQIGEYDAVVADYETQLKQVQQINGFLHDRLDRSQYGSSHPPDGALGALRRLTGRGVDDVQITFPNGFPTPVSSSDGRNWIATVPVTVRFPALTYDEASVVYRAEKIQYTFSSNGGASTIDGEQALDFEADGGHAQSYQVRLQAVFPKGANAYDLQLQAALAYEESYEFEGGGSYDLPSYREAPPLARSFYTSANPVGKGSAAQGVAAYEPEDASADQLDAETGSSPAGAAAAYNWAAERRSQLDQQASTLDQGTGFGLRFVVRHMEWVFGAIAAIAAYFLGYLDFIPPLKRLRTRNKDPDPFADLEADL